MSGYDEDADDGGPVVVEGIESEPQRTVSNPSSQRIELQPADFLFGRTLGEGAFARVVHARSKRAGTDFAIKIMEKRHIKKENKTKHVIMERRILTMVSHPFIVKFHFAFQDPEYLFMCMELVPGGILLDVILEKQRENESRGIIDVACDLPTTKFYMAETVSALEYLHGLGVLHRDLKPENILVSRTGHIKITDFGTAAICSDNQSPRTSFVGTQDYVSPEVLTGERTATKACDLWAVGCMVYQMLSGKSPFRAATEFLTFELIMGHFRSESPIEYPDTISAEARDLISRLLQPADNERLGAGDDDSDNGYPSLKSHPFFACIDWDNLPASHAPYQPLPSKLPPSEEMKDGASTEWLLDADPTPITPYYRISDVKGSVEDSSQQWNRFLKDGESYVFSSTIYKTVGLFSKKRQLILTDKPRLIYVDPVSMEQKGEIPWTKAHPISCSAVSSDKFQVFCETTKRTYYLSDKVVGAEMWIAQINAMLSSQNRISTR
jgi:3-phosphoinositide dependent protein kinase-1